MGLHIGESTSRIKLRSFDVFFLDPPIIETVYKLFRPLPVR